MVGILESLIGGLGVVFFGKEIAQNIMLLFATVIFIPLILKSF